MSTLASPVVPNTSKALHYTLWAVQLLLGAAFVMAGLMKATTPLAELAQKLPWVVDLPNLTRFIGVSELLGGFGLVLPAATRIQPKLTPLAGAALSLVMVLAAGFHVARGEFPGVVPNAVLGALAAFVAWGRFIKAPVSAR